MTGKLHTSHRCAAIGDIAYCIELNKATNAFRPAPIAEKDSADVTYRHTVSSSFPPYAFTIVFSPLTIGFLTSKILPLASTDFGIITRIE